MKRITKTAWFALPAGLTGWAILAVLGWPDVVKASHQETLTFDIACDCRTYVSGPNRGDPFIISGKIFPAHSLPSGPATNDPAQPINATASIGDWTCRGQNAFPLPAAIASAYSATPFAFFDWYFILKGGRGLTAAGYPTSETTASLSVSGIGSFSGARGDLKSAGLGTNATGCPNFRVKITFRNDD